MSVNVDPVLKNFDYENLPPSQRDVARLFQQLAVNLTMILPNNEHRTVALAHLVTAKDFAIWAAIGEPA